jgi:plasmid replication initiation protein
MASRRTSIRSKAVQLAQGVLFDSPLTGRVNSEHNLMLYPFSDLSRNAERKRLSFIDHNVKIEVRAMEGQGIATIYDRDLIIYAASIIVEKIERGEVPLRELIFTANDFFRVASRDTSKNSYELLEGVVERLKSTTIKTNIETGGQGVTGWFNWLSEGTQLVYDIDPETGKRTLRAVRIVLCEWLFRAILRDRRMLAVPHCYFDLCPIDRRLWDLCRVNCQEGEMWRPTMQELHRSVGSDTTIADFKKSVVAAAERNALPSFSIHLTDERAHVGERRRGRPSVATQIVEFRPTADRFECSTPIRSNRNRRTSTLNEGTGDMLSAIP